MTSSEGRSSVSSRRIQPERLLVYAGGLNPRRASLFRYLDPHAEYMSFPIGEEPKSERALYVVDTKIARARKGLTGDSRLNKFSQVVYLAADVQQQISNPYRGGFDTLGKPREEKTVRVVFEQMYRASKQGNPYYMIIAGSAILVEDNRRLIPGKTEEQCIVELDPAAVARFKDKKGFNDYLDGLRDFYASEAYRSGVSQPTDIRGIAAGLSLGTLVSMGAVTAIDLIPRDDPRFPQVFKESMRLALLGVSEIIPQRLQSSRRIAEWPWLNGVVHYALNQNRANGDLTIN